MNGRVEKELIMGRDRREEEMIEKKEKRDNYRVRE